MKYANNLLSLKKKISARHAWLDKGRNTEMEINVRKSKIMRILRRENPLLQHIDQNVIKRLENIDHFKYIISLVTKDVYCTKEITSRITIAKSAFKKKWSLLISILNLTLKKKLINGAVLFVNQKRGH